jgi:hypothetical protein
MTLISTGLVEFRETLARHIKELRIADPERYSTEWFFLRYLIKVARSAESVDLAREVSAMNGLTRYYVDRIEAGSELATRFEEILDAHRHALRMEHGS